MGESSSTQYLLLSGDTWEKWSTFSSELQSNVSWRNLMIKFYCSLRKKGSSQLRNRTRYSCICRHCGEIFADKNKLKDHAKEHSKNESEADDKSDDCSICCQELTQCSCDSQPQTHSGEKPYGSGVKPNKCEFCAKRFFRLFDLKVHLRIHLDDEPYRCNTCNKTFARSSTLRHHKRFHYSKNNNSRGSKHVVGQELTSSSSSQKHDLVHGGEKPYKCTDAETFCSKHSASGTLQKPALSHSGENPYKYEDFNDVCAGKKLKVSSTMTNNTLNDSIPYNHEDNECVDKVNLTLKDKEENQHNNKECQSAIADKELPTHSSFQKNFSILSSQYKIEHCEETVVDKRLSTNRTVKKHTLTHYGEKPYKCEMCFKGFTHRGNLTRHLKLHRFEKPYKCTECGTCFACKKDMQLHLYVHKGENPFQHDKNIKEIDLTVSSHATDDEGDTSHECDEKKRKRQSTITAFFLKE